MEAQIKISTKFNNWIHPIFVRYVMRSYNRKSKKVERQHPELFKAVPSDLLLRHKALWEPLGLNCSGRWLKFHVNLTGIQDYRFCPEDIFFARIERILNDCSIAGYGFDDKNLLSKFIDKRNLPVTVFRYINGLFLNEDYRFISASEIDSILETDFGDLIGKPCLCSSGGGGVEKFTYSGSSYFSHGGNKVSSRFISKLGYSSYIVQKKIEQASFPASFNPPSVNTLRMMTLRCPWNGEMLVLKTMLRMGVTNEIVDNMMKGGLCVNVGHDGTLLKYAYDYNGKAYTNHPVSGLKFDGLLYPDFKEICSFALSTAERIPYMNLLSFDLVPSIDGSIKCVELNATSQGITQLQYGHGGLFGDYSAHVVDWCEQHIDNDKFAHIRTFY